MVAINTHQNQVSCSVNVRNMLNMYGGSGSIAPLFLTLLLDGGAAEERAPDIHYVGGWVGLRAVVSVME